jgi:hypothetical protein
MPSNNSTSVHSAVVRCALEMLEVQTTVFVIGVIETAFRAAASRQR